ncbi:hypothetical protein B0H11DRAFT_2251465 [Mycena galericulata]|nr:hypothetical protein B0H11DRAFT_2251465 [Mycena galericulata]
MKEGGGGGNGKGSRGVVDAELTHLHFILWEGCHRTAPSNLQAASPAWKQGVICASAQLRGIPMWVPSRLDVTRTSIPYDASEARSPRLAATSHAAPTHTSSSATAGIRLCDAACAACSSITDPDGVYTVLKVEFPGNGRE